MYCPSCGQEPKSEDLKFCSKCGLSLGLVSEIVEAGGAPERLIGGTGPKMIFTRRNGLILCVGWAIFALIAAVPIIVLFNLEGDEITALALIALFSTLAIAVIATILGFRKGSVCEDSDVKVEARRVSGVQNANALPPHETRSASDLVSSFGSAGSLETNDFSPALSVTEETTKLLKKKKQIGS
ncbi:MAG: hypothetical protein KDB79_02810 [Acidobacteria bacterium]|nr:hypothetical protein [Acidobacteriota bacterium]